MSLLTSLISYWSMDGNSNDLHGSNNGVESNVTYASGKIGSSARFNGTNSSIDISDNPSLSTGDIDFTLSAWVKLVAKAPNPFGNGIAGKWKYSTNNREFLLWYYDAIDRFRFEVSPDGTASGGIEANALGSPNIGQWYFIVGWHDSVANTINIQINNGTIDSLPHSTGVFDGTSNFGFGNYENVGFLNGYIDEVGFWKRVLSPKERSQLYNNGNGLAYPLKVNTPNFLKFFP